MPPLRVNSPCQRRKSSSRTRATIGISFRRYRRLFSVGSVWSIAFRNRWKNFFKAERNASMLSWPTFSLKQLRSQHYARVNSMTCSLRRRSIFSPILWDNWSANWENISIGIRNSIETCNRISFPNYRFSNKAYEKRVEDGHKPSSSNPIRMPRQHRPQHQRRVLHRSTVSCRRLVILTMIIQNNHRLLCEHRPWSIGCNVSSVMSSLLHIHAIHR